ncbi:putative ABC transport system permease protein [Neorhizobium galegae]|uniref:ABC transporter permease n=1 Tax=Neorhizobium galegae TaxID=399 RepID=UPI001AEB5A42|nr:FtsX-like permease family protein [Neorhizobium galegae]MBP2547670.1 putative ABC transport system permease protein [Neorhizobium galegae]
MTLFDLARRNAWRKPMRTVLLLVCIAIAFLIYGLTSSFLAGSQGASAANEDILGVMSAGGRGQALPMALGERLKGDPDVADIAPLVRMRGFVGTERNVVAVSAADPVRMMAVNGKGLGLGTPQIEALGAARDTLLVGRALAEAQGFKVGQSVTVSAFDMLKKEGGRDWRFTIAGIFDGENASTDTYFAIARLDYVNAARARGSDTVDAFVVRPKAGADVGRLAARIDALFRNSASPTRTQSEKQFLEAFLRQYADVGLIVNLVVGAAFVTLMMIVVNTMVFAVRERRFEIGVLKTLGFPQRTILTLILFETLFLLALGGAIGLVLAKLGTLAAGPALGLVLTPAILARALGLIIGLGLAAGALPALGAWRMPIVSAFRTR